MTGELRGPTLGSGRAVEDASQGARLQLKEHLEMGDNQPIGNERSLVAQSDAVAARAPRVMRLNRVVVLQEIERLLRVEPVGDGDAPCGGR